MIVTKQDTHNQDIWMHTIYHRHPCRAGWDGQFSGVILFLVVGILPNHQDNHFWRRRSFINLHFSLSSGVAKSQGSSYRLQNQLGDFFVKMPSWSKKSSSCRDPPWLHCTRHPLLEQLTRWKTNKKWWSWVVKWSGLMLGRREAWNELRSFNFLPWK